MGGAVEQKVADLRRNRPKLSSSSPGKDNLDSSATLVMHSAAACGDVTQLTRILNARADPNAEDELGATVLEKACVGLHEEAAALLLDRGASARGSKGGPSTPLHRAAAAGGAKGRGIVKMLLATALTRVCLTVRDGLLQRRRVF